MGTACSCAQTAPNSAQCPLPVRQVLASKPLFGEIGWQLEKTRKCSFHAVEVSKQLAVAYQVLPIRLQLLFNSGSGQVPGRQLQRVL